MRRILFSPSWLARHAAVALAVVACVLLGRWQWSKALGAQGAGQNFAYGVQWWIFAAIIIFGWTKMIREELHPPVREHASTDAESVAYAQRSPLGESRGERTARVPQLVTGAEPALDDELAAYNDYLAWLNEHPRR